MKRLDFLFLVFFFLPSVTGGLGMACWISVCEIWAHVWWMGLVADGCTLLFSAFPSFEEEGLGLLWFIVMMMTMEMEMSVSQPASQSVSQVPIQCRSGGRSLGGSHVGTYVG